MAGFGGGEAVDDCGGGLFKFEEAFFGVFNTLVLFGKLNQCGNVFLCKILIIYNVVVKLTFGFGCVFKGVEEGERDLAFADVVTGRFADVGVVVVIENIIFYLKAIA